MRLLLLRFGAEIRVACASFCSRAPRAVVSLHPVREGPSAAKNKRRWVPFRVPSFVLVAQRRRRWRDPQQGHHGSWRSCSTRASRVPAFFMNS